MENTIASTTSNSTGEVQQEIVELKHITLTQVQLSDDMILRDMMLNNNNEDIHNISVVEAEQFCRVCGLLRSVSDLQAIFGECGVKLGLQLKILKHLQLQVEENDRLPQQVCSDCISQLHVCHQLSLVSHAADVKLRQMFLPQDLEPIPSKSIVDNEQEQDYTDDKNIEESKEKSFKPVKKDSSSSLLCYVCGKSFKCTKYLKEHKRIHFSDPDQKKHQCSICQKRFRSSFLLSEHNNVHAGTTPYSCAECRKQFHKRAQLKQHEQTHRVGEQRATCAVCGLSFARRANLQAHMRVHAAGRTFPCRLCRQQFPSVGEMLSHRRQHSQQELITLLQQGDVEGFKCEVCGKVFASRDSLAGHQSQHGKSGSVVYKCEDCGKTLRSRRSLAYHRRSQHSAQRSFFCTECPEGFMSRKLLAAHLCKHSGDKPFKCEICWSGFRSRSNLTQHLLKHQTDKDFECPICHKRFRRKGALIVHNRSHTGERPFVCDTCGRPFRQKNDMLKHQRSHAAPSSRTRTCDLCPATLGSHKDLVRHKESVHKEFLVELIPEAPMENVNIVPLVFETVDGQQILIETIGMLESDLTVPATSS